MNALYIKFKRNTGSLFNRIFLSFLLTFLIIIFGSSPISASVPDTKGTDFWVTYMPNYHNNFGNDWDYAKYGDSLYLFITSEVATTGKIEYKNRFGQSFVHEFSIPDPTNIYTFKVSWYNFELKGFNEHGTITSDNQCEEIAPQSFHITSVDDVTIYAHSQAVTTSDAFNVLPTDALGNNYFVLAYTSDGSRDGNQISGSSTPSQFAIVAPYDSTMITIRPSTATYANGKNTFNVLLNKGDVYLVQARISINNLNPDLTGTEINSTMPIAVFGGHQRATVPLPQNNESASRDFLCSQIPPIQSWGNNAIITPFPQPLIINNDYQDVFRILAAYDNTEIYMNEIFVASINKGQFFESDLIEPAFIRATAPILVAQYKRTSQNQNIQQTISDPMMMIIPQVEQFGNFYRFINIQSYEFDQMNGTTPVFQKVYDEQYLTIVAPQTTLNDITLDGMKVQVNRFEKIGNSNYYFATITDLRDGVHTLLSKYPVGIYVYGYGYANSYGYFGGMNFKILDFEPPKIAYTTECFKVNGYASDSTYNDTRIREVFAPENLRKNVSINIEPFTPYVNIVRYNAQLIDKYQDGSFQLKAIDSVGLQSISDIEIPGFTVKAVDDDFSRDVPKYTTITQAGKEICFEIVLHNYGKFAQGLNIANFQFDTNYIRIVTRFPQVIAPGGVLTVQICAKSDSVVILKDTLLITGDCDVKSVYAVDLSFLKDNDAPQYNSEHDPCNTNISLTITDSLGSDFGIHTIAIKDLENCTVETKAGSNKRITKLLIKVTDPYKDAYYKIVTTDSSGNESYFEEYFPGFTLSFPDFVETDNLINFGAKTIGKQITDSLKIHNYGKYDITIPDSRLFHNIYFSMPQSQFPVTIPPGRTKMLYICYRPVDSYNLKDRDTLTITFNCLNKYVALEGDPVAIIRNSVSICDVPLKMKAESVPWDYFLDQNYPNPAEGRTNIIFGLPEKTNATILIRDMMGSIVYQYETQELAPGIYKVEFELSNLQQGVYFYELNSGSVRLVKKMSITR